MPALQRVAGYHRRNDDAGGASEPPALDAVTWMGVREIARPGTAPAPAVVVPPPLIR